jgi:hypothetical protein
MHPAVQLHACLEEIRDVLEDEIGTWGYHLVVGLGFSSHGFHTPLMLSLWVYEKSPWWLLWV